MNFHQRRLRAQRGQQGFTMFEILVTLFLLTLWLLASAGVQSSSLKFSKAAQFRTQAIYLATDLAERMQANTAGAILGSYAVASTTLTSADIVTVTTCVSALCSPAALATFDVAEWKARVAAALPPNTTVCVSTTAVCGTNVAITNPPNPLITYTILISWTDRRTDRTYDSALTGTGENFSYTATKSVFAPPS
jgi:type IV pilus assembly protein PilV